MRLKHSRGLTLLELLVTLAIAAGASTLLIQALWQTYRVESLLADIQLRGEVAMLRAEWVRESLAGLQPGNADGSGRLRGEERELSGMSTSPIMRGGGGYGPVEFRLRFDRDSGSTLLEHAAGANTTAIELLRWPGDSGRFLYIGAEGTVSRQWPPATGAQVALPAAVVIETGHPSVGTLAAATLAERRALPTRQDFERL
jgi:prepilin-type N-terminal cleavage/methylation domain-containing protein